MKSTTARSSSRNQSVAVLGFLVCFLAIPLASFADTQWNVGVSGGSNGIAGFNISVGNYYHVPERAVVVIHERGIDEEELPVVFYIAQRAHVHPDAVVDLRLRGMSWMDITLYFGLSPEIYYVPIDIHRYGPPPGHAYGYYHHHPRGGWRRNDLHDRDIVNQVNMKFLSEHYKYAPERVMRYRSEGRRFPAIEQNIRYGKHGKTPQQGHVQNRPEGNNQGKSPVNYQPRHQDNNHKKSPVYYQPKGPGNDHAKAPVNYQTQHSGSYQAQGPGNGPWNDEQNKQARR